jgi:hypothetical protein
LLIYCSRVPFSGGPRRPEAEASGYLEAKANAGFFAPLRMTNKKEQKQIPLLRCGMTNKSKANTEILATPE